MKLKKVLSSLNKNGYCVVENVLKKKICENAIRKLIKLEKKINKNKYFIKERTKNGQKIIRDLVLRDPKSFLSFVDNKFALKVLSKILKDTFILDNSMASNSVNVKSNYKSLVHIDSHLANKTFSNTSDVIVLYCLDNFTIDNGATKIWPGSHLSGIRIQNDKNYSFRIRQKYEYAEAPKGSIIFFLGQTWHQIGRNVSSTSRWGIFNHYKRWWIKPATDFTKCGSRIFRMLNEKQKEIFGFNSISPKFNFKTKSKPIKTLRDLSKLSNNYHEVINY